MRALTLTQPYATLVAIGAKRIETRSWQTTYRGPLAIHAALRFRWHDARLLIEEPFRSALRGAGISLPSQLPRGVVIAVCDLTGCVETPPAGVPWRADLGGFRLPPDEPERAFGDYAPGRFAWRLENVRMLDVTIPAKGALGLWEWNGVSACLT